MNIPATLSAAMDALCSPHRILWNIWQYRDGYLAIKLRNPFVGQQRSIVVPETSTEAQILDNVPYLIGEIARGGAE